MNLYVRCIWILVAAFFGEKLDPTGLSRVRMRCWPNDLDLNRHMNNGRYLTLMDIGRFDLIVRSGIAGTVHKNKWYPVIAAQAISFYRQIGPMQMFELTTRISGWDDEWIYLEQEFYVGDKIAARGVLKTVFLGPEGKVKPQRLVDASGYTGPALELPRDVDILANLDHDDRRAAQKAKRLTDLAA